VENYLLPFFEESFYRGVTKARVDLERRCDDFS
jgi:hypothetical protein